jgi:hypothetical protein
MRIICPCALVLALLSCAAPARAQFSVPPPTAPGEDYRVEIGVGFWSPEPSLVIGGDGLSALGEEVDFVGEFGIPTKRFTAFHGTLKVGRKHKIRFEYIPFSYEEETTIQRRIVFAGQVFDIGVPAAADVEWRLWRAGYEWDFVSRQAGFLGFIAELKHNTVTAQIDSPVGSALVDSKAPVPAIGIIGRGYLAESLSITGEFTGFKMLDALTEDFEAEFWDWDLYATADFGRNVGVRGGYRSIDVEYIGDEDLGRLKMKGWYFGGVIRF